MTETDAQSFEHDSMSAEHLSQPEQLALFVNLDGFEGPIDLLLNLAREQKLDLKK
jgi:segregation and condensation protein A